MAPSHVMLLAFLIGVVCGLRSLTGPAVVAWAAHRGWIDLGNTSLHLMGLTVVVVVFTLAAVGELIADQLPSTPSRTKPPGLIARIVLGGLCGAAASGAAAQSMTLGALLGAAGGIAGAFGGKEVRTRTVRALKVPDFVIATVEDAIAIGAGVFLMSRF